MTENNLQKKPYPLGALQEADGIRFSFVSRAAGCGILLYDKKTGKKLDRIAFVQDDRIGNVYCKTVKNWDAENISWLFYEGDRVVPDERGRFFPGRTDYGKEIKVEDLKAAFATEQFDWEQDRFPRIPYDQAIVYCLHVRGFTKHNSSNVKHRGTFAGLAEKIPYLKEIGVTTVEVQPVYEFTELPVREKREPAAPGSTGTENPAVMPFAENPLSEKKLNYWGYKKGYYYAPKTAYAASDSPDVEFKTLIKELHKNKMELVMQFYFPEEVKRSEIIEILRFWVLEYHVDGFHLMGENLMADLLASDDLLADTKLWYYQFDTDSIYRGTEGTIYPHTAEYNDSWYYDMRRFLKGDGGMLNSVLYHMRHIPPKAGNIHYLTNYYGFTLADLVSFDRKHNEANGEENRDGNDNNCSWNCGEEGTARKKKVRELRLRQMKNAVCLLLLSQSTPLIFMGDEFGNTQKGNNNPYCQDNAVTWLDWSGIRKNVALLDFWKMLIDFRRKHPILHPEKELRLIDYIACGYPDLSYHGENAWRPQTDYNFRHIGIMFCGKYVKKEENQEDAFLYVALNMDWVCHELALPRLPRQMVWMTAFTTGEEKEWYTEARKQAADNRSNERHSADLHRLIAPRSIYVYISCAAEREHGEEDKGEKKTWNACRSTQEAEE